MKDYSSMSVRELEKEVEEILRKQKNQDDLFRAVVYMGQMDIAKYIYHDKKHQPDSRFVKGKTSHGETAAYGQALIQLLLLMKSRGIDFTRVFEHAVEHMKDDEWKVKKPANREEIRGHPVSGGRVIGKAFVATGEGMTMNAPEGSIIVLEHAEPELAERLATARAVVTDQGGRLCHMAIIAREHGLPAVIGTGNATSMIRTGDLVIVDADEGKVTISGK